MVRGAIAYGLILTIEGPNEELIKSTVLCLVLITMMILGGIMPKYISIILPFAKKDDNKFV